MALMGRNEELLISAGYDGWVMLWDIRSLRGEEPYMVAKFRAHGADMSALGRQGQGRSLSTQLQQQVHVQGMTAAAAACPAGQGVSQGAATTAAPVRHADGAEVATSTVAPPTSGTSAAASGAAVTAAVQAGLDGLEPEVLALKYDVVKKVIITAGTDRVIKVSCLVGYM